MPAQAKTENRAQESQMREPSKGGTKPADKTVHPSGDSPKPHGDKLEHAVDEAAQRRQK